MDIKIRCLLLDDELPGLTFLKMLCEQISFIEVVKAFNDPLKFIQESKDLDYDLCILDIEMPGLNGLEVAQLINPKCVIFTTAYKEFAAEAFDMDAVDYIRKPIQKERLEKALLKAQKIISDKSIEKDFIYLNTDRGKTLIFLNQILHITTADKDKRDKLIRLENDEILTLKNISFDQLQKILPHNKFCRINKKDLIAIKTVKYLVQDELITDIPSPSGSPIVFTLGDVYKDNFLSVLNPR